MADLLATLVHELRTPLTALRGALGLLESEVGDEPSQSLTGIAVRNAARLADLLDDVAAYARVMDPDTPVVPTTLDVDALLEDALTGLSRAGRTVGVVQTDAPCRVIADEALLRQAVVRMTAAAIRVTPHGGQVTLRSAVEDGLVVVSVADEGPAVPVAQQAALFRPLELGVRRAADGTDRPSFDLAIAAAVAARLGGHIAFRERPGGGDVRLTLGPACGPVAEA